MFDKYFTILHVIIFLARLYGNQVAPSQPSIRLALITDAQSSANWTGVFQGALKLHNKLPHLQHDKVKFEFVSFSKTDLRSLGDILAMLCRELLPRQVRAVFLSTESSIVYEFTQFIGISPMLILGTMRDPAFENKEVFQNYKYLRSPLTHQSEVILGILDSLQVNTKYAIIYETRDGNDKLAKQIISSAGNKPRASNVFEAELPSNDRHDGSAAKVLVTEELVKIKIQKIKVIILACREQSVKTVFNVAKELGMVSENYLWIGTESVVLVLNDTIEEAVISNFIGIKLNTSEETIALRALQILSSSVQANFTDTVPTVSPSINGSCFGESEWIPLNKLPSQLAQVIPSSSFDHQLLRDTYAILKLENNNSAKKRYWRQVGVQRNKESIRMERNIFPQELGKRIPPGASTKALRIVTILHGQYLYKVGGVLGCEDGKQCTRQGLQRRSLQPSCEIGVLCYEHSKLIINGTEELYVFCVSGLMIDLLGLIQNKLGFSYELYLVPDGKYGAIDDTTGRWNGMIGEVLYGKADMALGTITINAQRSRVVDFTTPYGEVGIGMLIANGNSPRPLITMEFLEPFGTSLWIAIVATIFSIFITLWLLDRNTSEFYAKSRRPFLKREKLRYFQREQSVTLLESMSYTWSAFVHVPAGSGLPRSLSARFVAIFFAFAMIILSSTYTANLAANKVKDDAEPPITSIRDEKMINPPPGFRFGTLKSSSTEAYFKFHRDPRMRKIYQNMKHHSVENVHDGKEKVKSGEISVYIDDHPYLEHMVSSQHDCSLRIVGDPFGISGYGVVLSKKSLWTQPISNSILRFSDDNVLAQLWSKWLVRKCMKKEDFETTPDRLSLYNYNGVFVLVAAGILISILFLGFERKVASYRAKRKEIVHGLERKDGGSKETLTDYFVDKFPSTITRLNSGTENNNVKSLSQLNFASSNSVLKLERCDDAQESKGLKFNSIC